MAPTYPFCNYHPGVPCIPKGRKVSAAGKGGAVERQWEGSSSFVHNIYEPLPYARKRCPVQGLIHLAQPSPFTHEASQLVEQPDLEQEHRERLPVSVWPGLSLAVPCTAVSAGRCPCAVHRGWIRESQGREKHPAVFCCEHKYGIHLMLPVIL